MMHYKPNLITAAFLVGGLSLQAFAVEQGSEVEKLVKEPQAQEKKEIEVIEVTGIRRSLIESVNMKRYSDTMVDAVTADDLGSLPDLSIADALSRLPGVTAVRNGGQSSELNIRGLSGQYVFSTINGRELVSTSGGRSVEFSQFPSELINAAQVHKSQKASLIAGGVAGTIDLKTANPLNIKDNHKFNLNAQLTSNSRASDHPDVDEFGDRVSFSYQGKFLDETLGVAVGAARLNQPSVSTQFVGYNFNYGQVRYDGIVGLSDCGNPDTDSNWVDDQCVAYSGGFEMMSRGGQDERNGLMTNIVFQPNDNLTIQGDAFYSKFDSAAWDRGLSVSGLGGITSIDHLTAIELSQPVIAGSAEDGYSLIGGTYYSSRSNPFAQYDPNQPCVATSVGKVQAPCVSNQGGSGVNPLHITNMSDDATRNSEVRNLGFNIEWQDEDYRLSLDLSHSKALEDSFDRTVSLLMFEDASADTPLVETDLVLDYQLNGLRVPQVNISNSDGDVIDFTDVNKMMVSSYSQFPAYSENQADAIRLDFEYQLDNDYFASIHAGVRFSERKHKYRRAVWSYGGPGHFENGSHVNKRSWDDMRLGNYIVWANGQEQSRYQPYQLSSDQIEVVNLGGEFSSLPSFLSIDNETIANLWLVDSSGNPLDRSAVDVWEGADWTITQDRDITEKIKSLFLMTDIDTELFDMHLTGNVGVRVIETEQTSFGVTPATTTRQQKLDDDGNPVIDKDGQNVFETVHTGDDITDGVGVTRNTYLYREVSHKFTDVLPSLNLSLAVTDNNYVKFAVARVMARPELSQMAVSGNFTFETNRERDGKDVVNLNASTSPFLEPFFATQYDISFEHYFTETDGNVFLALYHKDIESFTDTTTYQDFDFAAAGIEIPATSDLGMPVEPGDFTVTINNKRGGYLRGFELGYTQTFDFLPGIWSGLGFSGSYSHTESEITRTVNIGNGQADIETPIEGLSPNIYSFTLFFNYQDKIDTYLNARYRDEYLGRQISVGRDQSAFFAAETILDYQLKYNLTENLNMTFAINNLTDEANRSYFGDRSKTGTIQYFGRNYFLGMNLSF